MRHPMPYRWSGSAPEVRLLLWPHRSLPPAGFVTFISITAALLSLPLLAALGSPVLWGLLPFIGATLWALWVALGRSWRAGEIVERLDLSPDRITLTRLARDAAPREWQANPWWVHPRLHPSGGPVADYLTLAGGPREVELGAFLTPAERRALHAELSARLDALRAAAGPGATMD